MLEKKEIYEVHLATLTPLPVGKTIAAGIIRRATTVFFRFIRFIGLFVDHLVAYLFFLEMFSFSFWKKCVF
jgi:hypothetical protein